jgi:predicted Zn-dependent protease
MLAANSREHECEADETGLKIAALSCFNTHSGPRIFKKVRVGLRDVDLHSRYFRA